MAKFEVDSDELSLFLGLCFSFVLCLVVSIMSLTWRVLNDIDRRLSDEMKGF